MTVFDRKKFIELLVTLGPYRYNGGGGDCVFCGQDSGEMVEPHKSDCVWLEFEAVVAEEVPELTAEDVHKALAAGYEGAQVLLKQLNHDRLMAQNTDLVLRAPPKKVTREEALAWARKQDTVPDELLFGHPLPPPSEDSIRKPPRIPRTVEEVEAFIKEVGPLPSILATSVPLVPCLECDIEKETGVLIEGPHTCLGEK